jgi:hypothetical protein
LLKDDKIIELNESRNTLISVKPKTIETEYRAPVIGQDTTDE